MSTAAKLADDYDACLLGAVIGLHGTDRFAYSLKRLVQAEMVRTGNPAATCRETIAVQIMAIQRDHGPEAPVFVNDELMLGEAADEKPRLVLPGDADFRAPGGN